tara:strand:+ start:187 stop:672 length:486 start_codon:yes stop_codon:yes gene_type:complete
MIIRKLKETLGQVFHSPEASGTWGDDITVNMDGGVGGSWKVECAIDDEVVDCEGEAFKQDALNYYTGIPAPPYLEIDPWFSPPIYSEKQMSYKEAHEQAVAEQQILDESEGKESADIHQKLYEKATANWNTVAETQYQGGSENFQEGPGGWQSGTGLGQFR